jgi:hypothetical protein
LFHVLAQKTWQLFCMPCESEVKRRIVKCHHLWCCLWSFLISLWLHVMSYKTYHSAPLQFRTEKLSFMWTEVECMIL